jgi:hypothetical protein
MGEGGTTATGVLMSLPWCIDAGALALQPAPTHMSHGKMLNRVAIDPPRTFFCRATK